MYIRWRMLSRNLTLGVAMALKPNEEFSESFRELAPFDAVSESFDRMVALVDRRERACKSMQPCPSCGTEQVQLLCWFGEHPQWRCRKCGERWESEECLN